MQCSSPKAIPTIRAKALERNPPQKIIRFRHHYFETSPAEYISHLYSNQDGVALPSYGLGSSHISRLEVIVVLLALVVVGIA